MPDRCDEADASIAATSKEMGKAAAAGHHLSRGCVT